MKDNPRNPRKITVAQMVGLKQSLEEFGDLSGIVWNQQTGKLVGGHQRLEALKEQDGQEEVTIIRQYDTPTRTGTIAEGRVRLNLELFSYRVVDWSPAKEGAAMIAANKHGGSWDEAALARLLGELKEGGQDLEAIGISPEQELKLANLLKALEEKDESDAKEQPAQVKMVQCYMSVEQHIDLMKKISVLRKVYGAKDITETVLRALEKVAA